MLSYLYIYIKTIQRNTGRSCKSVKSISIFLFSDLKQMSRLSVVAKCARFCWLGAPSPDDLTE